MYKPYPALKGGKPATSWYIIHPRAHRSELKAGRNITFSANVTIYLNHYLVKWQMKCNQWGRVFTSCRLTSLLEALVRHTVPFQQKSWPLLQKESKKFNWKWHPTLFRKNIPNGVVSRTLLAVGWQLLCGPKVCDLDVHVFTQKNILWFQISVINQTYEWGQLFIKIIRRGIRRVKMWQ